MSEEASKPKNPSFVVPPPFDSESSGDCVLRSSDGVDFKVYRIIISIASTVFHDMFSLPPGPALSTAEQSGSDIPVIDLQEDAETLQALLQILYPISPPSITSLSLLSKLIRAFDKYFISLTKLRDHSRHLLSSKEALGTDPLCCFAISWRLGVREETVLASRYTHGVDLLDSRVADYILSVSGSSSALTSLWDLNIKRADALDDLLETAKIVNISRKECPVGGHYWSVELSNRTQRKAQLRAALLEPFPTFDKLNLESALGFQLAWQDTLQACETRCSTCRADKTARLEVIRSAANAALKTFPQEVNRFPAWINT